MGDLPGFGAFTDPLVGGMSILIRDAIRSRNYVAGVSGWSINKDGTAEFDSIVIRGAGEFGPNPGQHIELTTTGQIKIYDSANTLVMQLDGTGFLVQDIATGARILATLAAGVTLIALQPPDVAGYTFGSAFVYGDSDAALGDAWMQLASPTINGGDSGRITIFGANATSPTEPSTQIVLDAEQVFAQGAFALGRGPVARAYSGTDSAAVTAETTVLTSSSYAFRDGRAYKVTFGPSLITSNAFGAAQFRIRKNNAAGQLLGGSRITTGAPGAGDIVRAGETAYFCNTSGASVTCFIALTLANLDGGANTAVHSIGETGMNRWLLIEDCGEKDAFDWAPNLV